MPDFQICDISTEVKKLDDKHNKDRKRKLDEIQPIHRSDQKRLCPTILSGDVSRNNFYIMLEKLNMDTLDVHGWTIPNFQLLFIEAMYTCCLPRLYGNDYEGKMVELLQIYEIPQIFRGAILSIGRRQGKTWGVTGFSGCFAMATTNCEINIYSRASRQSIMLRDGILKVLLVLNPDLVYTKGEETLRFMNMYGTYSVINAYPASSDVRILLFFIYSFFGSGGIT
jgi:hypothetical protein